MQEETIVVFLYTSINSLHTLAKQLIFYTLIVLSVFTGTNTHAGDAASAKSMVNRHISSVYRQIDFSHSDTLSYEAFARAYLGYMNLADAGKLNGDKPLLTVCDFSLSANKNRMWIIDLYTGRVLLNTYVAHGQGSGEEYANAFSNKPNSHQSSLGFYVTGGTYTGKHGNSMYLEGMDAGYNSAAHDRAIVVHGAGYVSKDFVLGTGRLGRSWGCPAVSNDISDRVISLIKDGTCLFIYYPEQKYLENSVWLGKLPDIQPRNEG